MKPFSYKQRMKAVLLFEKYSSATKVIRDLGYPARSMLYQWINEYKRNGKLHNRRDAEGSGHYSDEEKQEAIEYFRTHGRSIQGTIKALGYPKKSALSRWILADRKNAPPSFKEQNNLLEYAQEQIVEATIAYCIGDSPISTVAKTHSMGVERIRKCAVALLGKEYEQELPGNKKTAKAGRDEGKGDIPVLRKQQAELEQQVKSLKDEVHQLRMERDILERAGEIIKKDGGISLSTMTNREKAVVIDALRSKYRLKELLRILKIAKSSYCYQEIAMTKTDKYAIIREKVKATFKEAFCRYGYRRIHEVLKQAGVKVSEKIVRLVMRQERLSVFVPSKRHYSSYAGEITPAVENIIHRDFHADAPNVKWLTDISEFALPAGKIYLSPMIDCFDGMPISWEIGTSPNAELTNRMLDKATHTLKEGERPIVHSDRGAHYRWPGWIERMAKEDLIRSMSKKGCSPDNAACEGFFGRVKTEMFYGHNWNEVTILDFANLLDAYLRWYCEKRIKLSLKGMSPINYRKSLGLIPIPLVQGM